MKSDKCIYDFIYKNIKLRIIFQNNTLIRIKFINKLTYKCQNKYTLKLKKQIIEYLNKRRKHFDIDFLIKGTYFQKCVWNEIEKIPYGKTVSYKHIAKRIGKPHAFRAVANACGKNPIPIVIPCHRVIRQNSQIGGVSGGKNIKSILLNLEGIYFLSNHTKQDTKY